MSSKSKELSPKVQTAVNKVIEQLTSGDLTPLSNLKLTTPPDDLPAAKWTYANTMMAYYSTGLNIDCRGFKQWKTIDRTVKKGEKAGFIWRPKTLKTEELDDDGNPKVIVFGFQPIPVFGLSQTEGADLPAHQVPTPAEPPRLADVAERLGVSVKYDWYTGGKGAGVFSTKSNALTGQTVSKSITLFTDEESVWWHELAHAAHEHLDPDFSDDYDRGEVIAEFSAAVIAQMYGRPKSGDAKEYLSRYSDDPVKAVMQSMSMIDQVLSLILDQ